MERKYSQGVYWTRIESIIGFIIYVARKYRYIKYRDMNDYLK